MLTLIAAVLAGIAFVVLFRFLWLRGASRSYGTLIAVCAAVLVLALALLAATGRLHWLVAIGAALLPFLRRLIGLIRYLPFIGSLLSRLHKAQAHGPKGPSKAGVMSRQEALDVLGLGSNPSRDEIVGAHRRLMQKIHPDRGGSTYLAQQLNEAKRILLSERNA